MPTNTNKALAALLRAAANQSIPESDFWTQFESLANPTMDPIAGLAEETAIHYWGNFHERNIFLIPAKPDRYQVQQGQEELNLIADGLEGDWPPDEVREKFRDI